MKRRQIPAALVMICAASSIAKAQTLPEQSVQPAAALGASRQLTLSECLKIAEEKHPDLVAARAMIEESEARLKVARASYKPQVNFTGSYIRQTYNYVGVPGTPVPVFNEFYKGQSASTLPYYNTDLNVQQTIYDFGRTRGAVKSQEAQLATAQEQTVRVRDIIDLNVRAAYYGVLAAEELVSVNQESVNDNTQRLRQVDAFYKVGTRPKIDVTTQEVELVNAQTSLRQSQADLEVSRAALSTSMGIPIDESPEPVNTLPTLEEAGTFEELIAQAQKSRPDLLALQDQVTIAQAQILIARANFKPNLSLAGFIDYANLKFPLVYNLSIGTFLAQNLFSGGANQGLLAAAQANERVVDANLQSLLNNIRQEVFADLSDLHVGKDKIELAAETVRAAKENLDLASGRYRAGYGNIIELTDAQTSFTSSQAQEVTTQYDYQIALARLDAAIGKRVQ